MKKHQAGSSLERVILFGLAGGMVIACGPEEQQNPRLLDSAVKADQTVSAELERLRNLQAVRAQVKLEGCVVSDFLYDDERFPEIEYYFSERLAEEDCPQNCTLQAGVCKTAVCTDQYNPEVCVESEWLDIVSPTDAYDSATNFALLGLCKAQGADDVCGNSGTLPHCTESACLALAHLCRANTALELGAVRVDPLEARGINYGRGVAQLRLPSQSTATNSALAQLARVAGRDAAVTALNALSSGVGASSSAVCEPGELNAPISIDGLLASELNNRTPAEVLIGVLAESYDLYLEATRRASEANIAVADTWRGTANLVQGVRQQMVGPELSRVASAHLWVGGGRGATGTFAAGFPAVADLSGGAEVALSRMRVGALCPDDVLALPGRAEYPISTQDLIYSTAEYNTGSPNDPANQGVPSQGSLVQRLDERSLIQNVDDGYFFESDGLTVEHFDEARYYLVAEYEAFHRDLDKLVLPESDSLQYKRFAATANPPSPITPGFLATMARATANEDGSIANQVAEADLVPTIQTLSQVNNAADFSDQLLVLTSEVLGAPGLNALTGSDVLEGELAYLVQRIRGEVQGRLEVCRDGSMLATTLFGQSVDREPLIIFGKSSLDCATGGSIEGEECGSTWMQEAFLDVTSVPHLGWAYGATTLKKEFTVGEADMLFAVRRSSSTASPGPGVYEYLAGVTVPADGSCTYTPITPAIREEAEEAVAISTGSVSHPSVECDGSDFDARIPLEDELSEDNDGVESSWKHYLALAKQAAAEADLLAQEYIQSGLEFDQREEGIELREQSNEIAAVNELGNVQRICGTNVDPGVVLAALRIDGEGNDFTNVVKPVAEDCQAGTCSCSEEAYNCADGDECIAGKCLTSPLVELEKIKETDPELKKLLRCLGEDDQVYAAVTPGDTNLCYWVDPTDENIVCADPNYITCKEAGGTACRRRTCPVTASSNPGGGDQEWCNLSPPYLNSEPRITTAALGYFDTEHLPPEGPEVTDTFSMCAELRRIRELPRSPERGQAATELKSTKPVNFFHPSAVDATLHGMQLREEFDTHVAVLLDGDQRWTTGSYLAKIPQQSVQNWPCADEYGCSGTTPSSLFCPTAGQCDTPASRGSVANRIRDAFLMLNWLGNDDSECKTKDAVDVLDLVTSFGQGGVSRSHRCTYSNALVAYPVEGEPGDTPSNADCSGAEPLEFPEGLFVRSCKNRKHPNELFYLYASTSQKGWYFANHFSGTISGWEAGVVFRGGETSWNTNSGCREPQSFWAGLSQSLGGVENRSCGGQGNLVLRSLRDPNFTFSMPATLDENKNNGHDTTWTQDTAMDALELYCMARAEGGMETGTPHCDRDNPWNFRLASTIDDFRGLAGTMTCMAQDIEEGAGHNLLFNFPKQATDALRAESPVGTYTELGGEVSKTVSAIRASLIELHSAGPLIATHMAQIGLDVESLRLALQQSDLRTRLNQKLAEQQTFAEMGSCIEAAAGGIASAVTTGGTSLFSTAAVCINSAVQIGLIGQIQDIENQLEVAESESTIVNFRAQFNDRASALESIASNIASAQERLDAGLADLENLRFQARRSLNNSVWLSSLQASQQFNINSVMRRRFNTAQVRYEEAFWYAKRMAILARRAIEARLGERLESMTDTLPLVPAPASWAPNVCSTSPVDYDAVRTQLDTAGDADSHYADSFIGSYVRNLEGVVESYRLVNNLHEGTDTAVISLKNDVAGTRIDCQAPSTNLVSSSGYLGLRPNWNGTGCLEDGNGEPLPKCVGLLEWPDRPPLDADLPNNGVRGSLITFGASPDDGDVVSCQEACGLNEDTRWEQSVTLEPGTYLLSWYGKKHQPGGTADAVNPTGEESVELSCPEGLMETTADEPSVVLDDGWARYTRAFVLDRNVGRQACAVAVVPVGVPLNSQDVLIGGVMLESVPESQVASPFESTDGSGRIRTASCEDTEGDVFRRLWLNGSSRFCDTGFSNDCPEALNSSRAYRELSFPVTQTSLEQGGLFGLAGFALGNFNYRVENIALNFVGTDVRNCENAEIPGTCYAAGYVPYSIIHAPPFQVRNYGGDLFDVPLFTGNIEHARGLATERYITNPLSDADKGLLADYTRYEFQGRPLDGNFVIRVWEDEGFDFNQIQDVQLILKYRYWTRFD